MSDIDKRIDRAIDMTINETGPSPETWVDANLELISEGVRFLKYNMRDLDSSTLPLAVNALNTLSSTLLGVVQLNSPRVRRAVVARIGTEISKLLLQAAAMLGLMELDQLRLSLLEKKNFENSAQLKLFDEEGQVTSSSALPTAGCSSPQDVSSYIQTVTTPHTTALK